MMVNLQGLTFSKNLNACHFMNHWDKAFKSLHNAMNNLSKQLLAAGVGAVKQQARVITEKELWEKGVMGKRNYRCFVKCNLFLLWHSFLPERWC